jgi:hypothetical protein
MRKIPDMPSKYCKIKDGNCILCSNDGISNICCKIGVPLEFMDRCPLKSPARVVKKMKDMFYNSHYYIERKKWWNRKIYA